MSNLKIATYQDFPYVYRFVLNFIDENYRGKIAIDDEKIVEMVDAFLKADQTEKIIVLGLNPEGQPIGLIGAQVHETMFSRDKVSSEVMWWIEPEHRGSRIAFELLDAFEFWSRKVGAKYLHLSTVESDKTEKIARLYSRRGFNLLERSYIKGTEI